MAVIHTVTSANILPFVLPPAPFVPMGTFFHTLFVFILSFEGEKSLAMVLDEDSEGSDQNIVLTWCMKRNEGICS